MTETAASEIAMSHHEQTALVMIDFGFNLPGFDDAIPRLAEKGWVRSYAGRWQVTGAGRRAMRGLPPQPPAVYGCDHLKHADTAAAQCRWPVHCAFCGKGLGRWYYGGRAPMCPWCHEKNGPMLPPASWEMDPEREGPEARRVWESWTVSSLTGQETER